MCMCVNVFLTISNLSQFRHSGKFLDCPNLSVNTCSVHTHTHTHTHSQLGSSLHPLRGSNFTLEHFPSALTYIFATSLIRRHLSNINSQRIF